MNTYPEDFGDDDEFVVEDDGFGWYSHEEFLDDIYLERTQFADPGGRSALRAETPTNPRNLPCPTCEEPDRLTPEDARLGYQCDTCADKAEGYIPDANY